jgi:hypothetical protein
VPPFIVSVVPEATEAVPDAKTPPPLMVKDGLLI